ncbi:MAG TPA: undecaprenyl-phosphate glucose phosphotransferase [Azospirillum sp.]|nr:undecaprenyl-phosphate glucose phosphotransferase [Azospirillum sp.]
MVCGQIQNKKGKEERAIPPVSVPAAIDVTIDRAPPGADGPLRSAGLVAQALVLAGDLIVLSLASAALVWPNVAWSNAAVPRLAGTGAGEAAVAAAVMAGLYAFKLLGLYRLERLDRIADQIVALLLGSAIAAVLLLAVDHWLARSGGWPGNRVAAWFIMVALGTLLVRRMWAQELAGWRRAGRFARRVAVVGAGEAGGNLVDRLAARGPAAIHIVGVFAHGAGTPPDTVRDQPVLGGLDALPLRLRENPVDDVIVALPWTSGADLRAAIEAACRLPVDVWLLPDPRDVPLGAVATLRFAGLPMLHVARRPLGGWSAVMKRAEDLLLAGSLLLVTAPLMALITAAIMLTDRGPVFFRQERFGFKNRVIRVWKFRTMYADRSDPSGGCRTVRNDPRVTPLGHWLRRFSLDELPQLFNVLRGEMSIVGPRAHAVAMRVGHVPYDQLIAEYAARHRVLPGMTGWAQVNGLRGEIDTPEKARKRVEYDLAYIENWSILLDLNIIARTAMIIFKDDNAY